MATVPDRMAGAGVARLAPADMPLESRALAALQMLRAFAYDENSNPVSTTDAAHARNNSSDHPFDVVYGVDDLNRVIAADEGNIASGVIESGTRTRRELWYSLSLTGNWGNRQLDANGDGDFGDETDRDEPSAYNTFNTANEWTARRVAKAGGTDRDEHAYTHDAVGNLTDLARTVYRGANTALTHRRLVYDAFGRLVRAASVEGMDETDIALYRYNGLNMRLMWQDDADADSTLESSERFYVMHDERWRPVATFRDTDSTPKEAFVWHAAGVFSGAGFQPASYIDSLILRDRDNYTSSTPNPMTSASDGTLEERRYFCQNWRADVVAVTKSDGTPIEYVRYSAYGEPTVYPVADLNMDGVVNSTDSGLWSDLLYSTSNASVYADTDLDWDGADDWNSGGADGDLFYESYAVNLGLSGVGRVSSPGVSNRTGYAAYQWDQTLGAYHVRYRVYLPDIGRWTRRDPLGYEEGMSVLEYLNGQAVAYLDPYGLGYTSIDAAFRQCMQMPTISMRLECLQALAETLGASSEVRKRILQKIIDRMRQEAQRQGQRQLRKQVAQSASCRYLYLSYKVACAAGEACGSCDALSCSDPASLAVASTCALAWEGCAAARLAHAGKCGLTESTKKGHLRAIEQAQIAAVNCLDKAARCAGEGTLDCVR
jgi:RHS repeat-associated protein